MPTATSHPIETSPHGAHGSPGTGVQSRSSRCASSEVSLPPIEGTNRQ